ncbi:1344_t:CDS:2 [Entrophospora sp. SA101]|nr:1344_t:CDS:2 [Entrophospora sp. SA101]
MPVNQLRQVLMDLTADNKLTAYLLELWGLQGYLGISHKLQVTRDLELITGGGDKVAALQLRVLKTKLLLDIKVDDNA